jgi:hypothetical protein
MAREKMKCLACGAEMNHHAAKLVEPRNAREAAQMDAAFGALILEGHSCPKCGTNTSRRSR